MAAIMEISLREDELYWPDCDINSCYDWVNTELYSTNDVVEACNDRRSIVHAGANVGSYALKFAEHFKNVYAFEPEETNFKCLSLNTADTPNISIFNSALGETSLSISLNNLEPNNCGTFYVFSNGNIPMVSIDSLNLPDVDCIHLDIEGFELFALKGAINTIEKFSPTIVVEWLEHGKNYGVSNQDITNFLINLGYSKMKQTASDMMFKK